MFLQGRKERGKDGGRPPTIMLSKKIIFHVRPENIKLLHVNNIWDLNSEAAIQRCS